MNLPKSLISPFLIFCVLGLIGCDFGRVGMYKVRIVHASTVGATAPTQQIDEDRLKQLIRQALAGRGFREHPGTAHLWQKRGAWVEVSRDETGELILKVRAFGSKRDVRVSERTEQELVAMLKEQPGLELTPMTPSKPPLN